jgi:hypothetical protein
MESATSVDADLLRKKTAEAVKRHKASWVELGQFLYSIHHDKLFKSWGYLTFEAYVNKELRLKSATAGKLLKSYQFLEKEEPRFVKQAVSDEEEDVAKPVPHYESVNLLRLARQNKNITPAEFADIREAVLVKAQEPQEVRSQVKKILAESIDEDSEEAARNRKKSKLRRLISLLSGAKRELESEGMVPKFLIKQIDDLTQKLEDQLGE